LIGAGCNSGTGRNCGRERIGKDEFHESLTDATCGWGKEWDLRSASLPKKGEDEFHEILTGKVREEGVGLAGARPSRKKGGTSFMSPRPPSKKLELYVDAK
jgi:hypothetical protein